MFAEDTNYFPGLVKETRRQLGLSQEELARELGVSFATVNRWENEKSTPSKLGKAQFDAFFRKMTKQKKLSLDGESI